MSVIGDSPRRREDQRFLTGRGRYLDDLVFPGALVARFVRSPHAHARILGIDADVARTMPGIELVATGADFAQWTSPLRMAPPIDGLKPVTTETMPSRKIRFDGDLVACVVAGTRNQAEDAAEQVAVSYEALPPVVDTGSALAPGAPLVDDTLDTNLISHQGFSAASPRRIASSPRDSASTARRTHHWNRVAAARSGMRDDSI